MDDNAHTELCKISSEEQLQTPPHDLKSEWVLYEWIEEQEKSGAHESFTELRKMIDDILKQDNSSDFPFFIPKELLDEINSFLSSSSPEDIGSHSNALNLCKSLLMRAIHFLRCHDIRERLSHMQYDKDCKFESVSLHEFGLEELYKYYDEFAKNHEGLYYGLDEYYRDHIRHPLYVWLIGMRILKKVTVADQVKYQQHFKLLSATDIQIHTGIRNQEHMDDARKKEPGGNEKRNPKLDVWTSELVAMWTIIAITHDLGYPFERFERLNLKGQELFGKIKGINLSPVNIVFSQQHSFETQHFLEVISSKIIPLGFNRLWRTQIRPKYYLKFAKSFASQAHGILSAWLLWWYTPFFTEIYISKNEAENLGEASPEESRQFAIRAEILSAISSHTTNFMYYVTPFTLSFLLVLCDELQEWGRPTLQEMQRQKKSGFTRKVILKEPRSKMLDNKQGWLLEAHIQYSSLPPSKGDLFDAHFNFAKAKASTWFKRLRPAIDDNKRLIEFVWKMEFPINEERAAEWIFKFNSIVESNKLIDVALLGPDRDWYKDPKKGKISDKHNIFTDKY